MRKIVSYTVILVLMLLIPFLIGCTRPEESKNLGRHKLIFAPGLYSPGEKGLIYSMSGDGSDETLVGEGAVPFFVSPGGERFAYAVTAGAQAGEDNWEIFLTDFENGESRMILETGAPVTLLGWLSEDEFLIHRTQSLLVLDVEEGEMRVIASDAHHARWGGTGPLAAISVASGLIAYISTAMEWEDYVRDDCSYSIVVIDISGENVTRLDGLSRVNAVYSFLNDGSGFLLRLEKQGAGGAENLHVFDMKSRELSLPLVENIHEARWSPDGNRVAFSSKDSKLSVLDLKNNEKQPRVVVDDLWREFAWSPDGKYLAFTAGEWRDLYTIKYDGSNRKMLVKSTPYFDWVSVEEL